MKISKKALFTVGGFLASTGAVFAQAGGSSSLLPPALQALFDLMGIGGVGVASFINQRVQFAIYLVLGLIILVAVVYSIMAGIKYIRSEGDPGKIEEAQKSIKAILMGIASIFVGILGIILVYVIFNQNPQDPTFVQSCISGGNSVACYRYTTYGAEDTVVSWCEGVYEVAQNKDNDGNFIFKEGVVSKDAARLGQFAVAAGYTVPTGVSALGYDGNPITSFSQDNAALLCINPALGGYSRIVE